MGTEFESFKIYINLCQIFLEIKMDFKLNLYLFLLSKFLNQTLQLNCTTMEVFNVLHEIGA
jgi:hypothetical protein